MNPLFLAPVLELGKTLLDRFIPDPEKKQAAEAEFLKLAMDGELKQVVAQLEINAREAQHPSVFVAGWRPAAGWAGVFGLVYVTIFHPLAVWLSKIKGWPEPPLLDAELLTLVLTGMLGIGGLRTYEKKLGIASK